MFAISLKDLSVGYGKYSVLNNINLDIKSNTCVALYGDNGCGKTTLIRTMQTIIPKLSGSGEIMSLPLEKRYYKDIRKKCASVFQVAEYDRAFPVLVSDVVLMARYARQGLFKRLTKEDEVLMLNAMSMANVLDIKDRPYGMISGGQRQRVNLAQAIAAKPEIMYLDEPNTFLDEDSEKYLIDAINEIKQNMTVVIVSHNIDFICSCADSVAVLADNTVKSVYRAEDFYMSYCKLEGNKYA